MHATQDEREVKRQRRKQSNRESARRSRLRKQAECEALAVRVNELMNENVKLRAANEQLLKLQQLSSHQVSSVTAASHQCALITKLCDETVCVVITGNFSHDKIGLASSHCPEENKMPVMYVQVNEAGK